MKQTVNKLIAFAVLASAAFIFHSTSASAATFTVNSANDSDDANFGNGICADSNGDCTFRAAAHETNALVGADTIHFDIPGAGPHFMEMSVNGFPNITSPLTIDATAGNGGSTCATESEPAHPNIVFDARNVFNAALYFAAGSGGSSLKGISYLSSNGQITVSANDITLRCNYINQAPDGTPVPAVWPGPYGIFLGTNTSGLQLGGSAIADRNYFAGTSVGYGDGASDILIENNFIGTNFEGTEATVTDGGEGANTNRGIMLCNNTQDVLIKSNLVSGRPRSGIHFIDCDANESFSNITISGNKIGTDTSGTAAIPNGQSGIEINNNNNHTFSNIVIGGPNASDRNIISGNGGGAITATGTSAMSNVTIQNNYLGTDITGNEALLNGSYGISLEPVSNNWDIRDNVIIANNQAGIGIYGDNHQIVGNIIGLSADQSQTLGDLTYGMFVASTYGFTHDLLVSENVIGGFNNYG